ncbi:hypothetical protein [Thioalkalivibrio sp. HL-Eb18]|uniref:hypothetical protein n=1 Tax=Thioalkalivibrio sp. HL-Eb18 TaxID=1266913 RepID=UPI00036B37CC|nr:hypothetical protein [Thioalkalivibrio sp. HL-Eb18]
MQGAKWTAALAAAGLMLLGGCAANETRETDAGADTGAEAAAEVTDPEVIVAVPERFAYSDDATVSEAIRRECELEERFPGFVQEFGARHDVRVETGANVSPGDAGKVLVVKITQARNDGNAWSGHRSLAEAEGTLYENGEAVAEFTSRRVSGGGAFGGFKGSCSVMGRTVRAMGADIASWVRLPEDGAHLGN